MANQRMLVEVFFDSDNVSDVMEPIKAISCVSEAYIEDGPEEVTASEEDEEDETSA